MKRIVSVCSLAILLASSVVAPAMAEKGWVKLGSKTVSDNAERDVINARGRDKFTKIRLCILHRAVRLNDLDVSFGNGQRQDIKVRSRLKAGTCTRNIDLRGGKRDIKRVIMKYETIRDKGRQAVVEVYARS